MLVFFGSSISVPTPLTITQRGEPDLHFTAHWATQPFLDTWYYAGRIGVWSGNRGWLFDFTHHKIYLTNGPAEVQQFRITNGMNLFTVSIALLPKSLIADFSKRALISVTLKSQSAAVPGV